MASDQSQEDPDWLPEVEREVARCEEALADCETCAALVGPHSHTSAYLRLQPGAGGVDACAWVEMLLHMYLNWAKKHSFTAEILEGARHEEAGFLFASLHIKGAFVYGKLQGETGVHRLVRVSPFDSQGRRHNSFAAIDVLPDLERPEDIVLLPQDLFRETFRTGGPGGQFL